MGLPSRNKRALPAAPIKPLHQRPYARMPGGLVSLREQAGLTQTELARRLKKPQSYVCKTEQGSRRCDISEFILWAQACDLEPAHAIGAMEKLLGRR